MGKLLQDDKELLEYKDLMPVPTEFKDGFGWKTVLAALFIAFVMYPGSIYLGLVAGQGMGPAAQWVTVILFIELSRRSFTKLTQQEIYILVLVSGGVIAGGPFAGFVWNQFFRASPAASGITHLIPDWVSPAPTSPAVLNRTFMHRDWLPAIAVVLISGILGKAMFYGLGYLLFRLTSDIEKLPYPMAPVAAQGAIALAETFSPETSWRWRYFSIGSIIGLVFGTVYIGIPTITGMVLTRPVELIPIPFIDFTPVTETILPATPVSIGTNFIGPLLAGLILPYWLVVGSFIAALTSLIINPVLYKFGVMSTWRPGMDTLHTGFAISIDFWLSFGIGLALAVAILGLGEVTASLRKKTQTQGNKSSPARGSLFTVPAGRGDFPVSVAVGLFIIGSIGIVLLCHLLVPDFPVLFLILFGFFISPLISYVNARLNALSGQFVGFPMLKEATFILSGYKGAAVWFAPFPLNDYGGCAQSFRELELTGTKFTSFIKADLLMFPLVIISSFVFWSLFWKLAPIPSVTYPFTQKMWYYQAMQNCLWISSTVAVPVGGGQSFLLQALKLPYIFAGAGIGLVCYYLLLWLGLPLLLVYGFVRGIGGLPYDLLIELVGAFAARYYLVPKLGQNKLRLYAVVLSAGIACGMGLVGMGCSAIALITKSVTQLPF